MASRVQRLKEKTVSVSDIHAPFHDEEALQAVIDFIGQFKPRHLVLNGDILDCYTISKFEKNSDLRMSFQDELDATRDVISRLIAAAPAKCRTVYLQGNHEDRHRRLLWDNPALADLRNLQLSQLLKLRELGVKKFMRYGELHNHLGVAFTHGSIARKHGSYTARAEREEHGISGVSGHTHRLGVSYKTYTDRIVTWYEQGCLCDLKPGYIRGTPNWQHGFLIGWRSPSTGRLSCQLVPVFEGEIQAAL